MTKRLGSRFYTAPSKVAWFLSILFVHVILIVILSERSGVEGPLILSSNHTYWVYILSNKTRSTLYIGITDNLERRISQHRAGEIPGFARQYHCIYLVYFETIP